jgi:hypothetical protein
MVPGETVKKSMVQKLFIKIFHNRLRNCQDVVEILCRTQKPDTFQRFCPTFQKETFSTVSTAHFMPIQEYWWTGLGTILALARAEITPFYRNQLQGLQTA